MQTKSGICCNKRPVEILTAAYWKSITNGICVNDDASKKYICTANEYSGGECLINGIPRKHLCSIAANKLPTLLSGALNLKFLLSHISLALVILSSSLQLSLLFMCCG